MTTGLRCPNCDTTINRRVVSDWLVNKKDAHLNCSNMFCNTRWSRAVLEQHADKFLGEVKAPEPKKAEDPTPVVHIEETTVPARTAPACTTSRGWLERIRKAALHHTTVHGVVSIDDLRVWADAHEDHPPSPSTWGSVFYGEQWMKVGEKRSSYSKSRARKVSVWAPTAAAPLVYA